MKRMLVGAALAAALCVPAAVSAQAWDSPMLMPPRAVDDFGIYLVDLAGAGVGVMGTWRSPGYNFGLRAGIAERSDDGIAAFGGVDYNGAINRATDAFPLDIDWVLGAGLGAGDGVLVSIPLGLSAGHTFTGDGASFTPYVTPRVVLDAFFDSPAEDGLDLDFAVDVGLDLRLGRASNALSGVTIRFGGTLGNREAVAIGVVF